MKKNLKIKFRINFEIEEQPPLDDWNKANDEQKKTYIIEKIKEYIDDNIDDMIHNLMDERKIKY